MQLAPSRCSRRAASVRLNPTGSVTNLLSTVAKGKACHASASLAVDTAGPFAERTAATGGRRSATPAAAGAPRTGLRADGGDGARSAATRGEPIRSARSVSSAPKARRQPASHGWRSAAPAKRTTPVPLLALTAEIPTGSLVCRARASIH